MIAFPSSQRNIFTSPYSANSNSANSKTELLKSFDALLNKPIDGQAMPDDAMVTRHNALKLALCGQRESGHRFIESTYGLFENRNTRWGSWGTRACTESGSLALIAFTLKVFGDKILTPPGYTSIDPHKLDMAMHMLFGHDMPRIKSDLFTNIRLVAPAVGDCQYTLHTKHYEVDVVSDYHPDNFDKLVNSSSVNQTYFHKMKMGEVLEFFGGSAQNIPSILKECTGKNFQTDRNRETDDNAHRRTIKKDKTLYSNNVTTALSADRQVSTSVQLVTLLESTPSSYNKAKHVVPLAPEIEEDHDDMPMIQREASLLVRDPSLMDRHLADRSMLVEETEPKTENRKEYPTNVYQANISLKVVDSTAVTSHVTLVGSQMNGTHMENTVKATKVIESLKFDENRNKKQNRLILDLRFYTSIKKTLIGGDERQIWDKHTNAMQSAVNMKNGTRRSENEPEITYLPVHIEAHSDADKIVPTVFTAGATIAYNKAFNKPCFDTGHQEHTVGNMLYDQFKLMTKENQEKYKPVYLKWLELHDQRTERSTAGPYAAITDILVNAINNDPNTDTLIELLMGCKSAKDRTTSVLKVMTLLEPLILMELAKPDGGDITRFFTSTGTLNFDGLTPDEKLFIKERYDIRLLHAANNENEEKTTNVSVGLMKDFAEHVDFIKDSSPYTVGTTG